MFQKKKNDFFFHTCSIGSVSTQYYDIYDARVEIYSGDIVLTEADLPDCELPRSNEPNCEVGVLENGQGALIAIRNINEGDFFSIANSSSDEDDLSEDAGDSDDNA